MTGPAVTLELLAELLEETRAELAALRTQLERTGEPRARDRLLSRSDLRELGLERRAVDASLPLSQSVRLPGYARPPIREADYFRLLERARTPTIDYVRSSALACSSSAPLATSSGPSLEGLPSGSRLQGVALSPRQPGSSATEFPKVSFWSPPSSASTSESDWGLRQ